jgi:hypothetical protein
MQKDKSNGEDPVSILDSESLDKLRSSLQTMTKELDELKQIDPDTGEPPSFIKVSQNVKIAFASTAVSVLLGDDDAKLLALLQSFYEEVMI